MLFRQATGWLGWSPQQAMTTRIPLILLALEGKAEFIQATNPFGGGKKNKEKQSFSSANSFRFFAAQHNERFKGR